MAASPVGNGAIQLQWPTGYRVITQAFGANPDLYVERGLPGHEGLDIRAPNGAKIYACADGVVEAVQERILEGDPYGRWVRLLHADGYRTLYGHLGKASVNKGSKVKAGQQIGLAGPSGETAGGHIHLGLMQAGATEQGLTHYPADVLDPTPFLMFAQNAQKERIYPWPVGRCLMGVTANSHGSLPGAGSIKVEAVKIDGHLNTEHIGQIRKSLPDTFLLTSLRMPSSGKGLTPREWIARLRPSIVKHAEAGISYFEVLRRPNTNGEGCYVSWNSGGEFARWWIDAVNLLKQTHPLGKFGFPGLAAGPQVTGQRMDAQIFMEQADEALLLADWIGLESYWSSSEELLDEGLGARHQMMRRWYPDKLLFVTEFGNVNALTDQNAKMREYVEFIKQIETAPGIGAAFLRVA
ncbi:MAG: M23 family metallopeptidase [Anaerolineales bacterium]